MYVHDPRRRVRIRYRNGKGVVEEYVIVPMILWYGSTEYHPQGQWMIASYDVVDQKRKDFAAKDVIEWVPQQETA